MAFTHLQPQLPRHEPGGDIAIAEFVAICHRRYGGDGIRSLQAALEHFAGRIAVVSSYGAQSAVLLAHVAAIAPQTPVLFIDTGKLFAETLDYRQDLTARLGLRDVRDLQPRVRDVQRQDPAGDLHRSDPEACCALRKVAPLGDALEPFAAWVTGRRRNQSVTRSALPVLEMLDGRLKINPLAHWDDAQVEAEMTRRRLPRHGLVARGYSSIGCAPCTRAVAAGDHPRSGRWAGLEKTECGIHRAAATAVPLCG